MYAYGVICALLIYRIAIVGCRSFYLFFCCKKEYTFFFPSKKQSERKDFFALVFLANKIKIQFYRQKIGEKKKKK